MSAPVLEVSGLNKSFGGLDVAKEVSFSVDSLGDIIGLIGPNGAGKTTVFNMLTGLVPPDSGTVALNGQRIDGLPPHRIAASGVSRTFQDTRLFDELTVAENVFQGRLTARRRRPLASLLASRRRRSEADRRTVDDAIDAVGLAGRSDVLASTLAHADRSLLGIAMALAAQPSIVLLDEPFGGMNDIETLHTMDVVRAVAGRGVAVLLVEHVMKAVMGLCGRIEVLNFGVLIASGTPEETSRNPDVIDAYLGTGQ